MKKYAILGLLAATILWGCSYSFSKLAMADVGPSGYLAYRMLVAFVVLSIIFWKRYQYFNLKLFQAGLAIGIPLGFSYLFFMLGLDQTSAAKTGFLSVSYIMFVPFMTAFFNKNLPRKNELLGVGIAFVGLGFLCLDGSFTIASADWILIAGAVFYAMSIVLIGRYAAECDALMLAILQIGICCIMSFCYGAVTDTLPDKTQFSTMTIGLILFVGIFSTAFAIGVQNWAQQYVSPTATSIIFVLEPVVAAICGYFVMHEVLTLSQGIGCVLIIGAMFCGIVGKEKN